MEIDIPDLNDVRFQYSCNRCYFGNTPTRIELPRERDSKGRLKPAKYEIIYETCPACNGTKISGLTPVGERLIEFLKYLGVEMKRDG